jgi:Tfp pilus assembly protein PilX
LGDFAPETDRRYLNSRTAATTRGDPLLRRLRQRVGAEDGFALVLTIGISLVLGIAGTTSMLYTTANETSSQRSKADRRAQALAEAGLAYAYSTLYNASDPTQPGAVPQRSEPLEGGTATYYGTLDTQTDVWTLTGIGQVANSTQAADVRRTVRGKVALGSGQVGTANNAIWNYIYAEAPTSCMSLGNSVNVAVPLYVAGDLCLANSSQISGSTTVLQVGGKVTISNSAHVGLSGSNIAAAHIAGGCQLSGGTLHNPCSSADQVYANSIDSQTTGLTKPPVDLAGWYQNAQPGPMHGCTTGSFPGGFDNDTTLNRSLPTAVDLTPSTAYDCQVRDAQGALVGRLAWSPSTKALTIHGTIFFDGDIGFANSTEAYYSGRGTIYASGTITMNQSTRLCGVSSCDGAWAPLQNLLAFVAGSSTDATGFRVRNSGIFQGAVYAVKDYSEENSATVWGPIIARQVFLQNSATNHYVPLGTLLPGMPATYQEVVTLTNQPASWG